MAQLKPILSGDPGPHFKKAYAEALETLRRAADEWAKGDPERRYQVPAVKRTHADGHRR